MKTPVALEKLTRKELLVKAYFYKGTCHATLNEHEEAVKCYDFALSIQSEELYILIAKVISLIEINDIQQAQKISDSLIQELNTRDIYKHEQSEKDTKEKNPNEEEIDPMDVFFPPKKISNK